MEKAVDLPGGPGTAVSCPCCGGLSLELFEDTLDIDGNIVGVQICLVCCAIVNRSSLERLIAAPETLHDAQTKYLSAAYSIGHHFSDTLEREVESHRRTLDFFLTQTSTDTSAPEMIAAEIGIGRGTLLRAAAAVFKRCYGIDLAYDLFDKTVDHLAVPDNVVLLESLNHVPEPLDLVLAWHSLEHVPRLHDLVAAIRDRLKPRGYLFFQVPLYRPNYIVESHYTFLNRRAVSVLAELERFRVVDMWTDHDRSCITCLLQKPEE